MPQAAGRVQAVALGLPGGGVADEGVQRVPVEGGLDRAVGSLDGAERARDPGCGSRSLDRRPVLRARPVAVGLGRRVRGERVERETLAAGQYCRAADRGGFQGALGRRDRTASAGAAAALPLAEDVPDEPHAASTAAAAAMAGSASSIRRRFGAFSRVSDLIIAFSFAPGPARAPAPGGRCLSSSASPSGPCPLAKALVAVAL